MEYFHGREYAFDSVNMMKELFTLGIYVTPDEKKATLVSPEIGIFSAEDFDPGDWKPSFQAMPFDNMTREDAYWATRVILSFSQDDVLNIVRTAEYTNPRATEYMFRTLMERRRLIAGHWLEDVNPISNFALDTKDGVTLSFRDLRSDHDLAGPAEYRYEIITNARRSEKASVSTPRIPLGQIGGETQVRIWTVREKSSSNPVTVYVQNKPAGGFGIFRIERS